MKSFVIYSCGLASLFLADLFVTRFLSPEDIARWAEARALIGLLGVLAAGGLDLVMVRSPRSSGRLLRLAAVQVPLLALLLGLVVHEFGYLSGWNTAAALAAGSGFGLVLGQYFRAHHRYLESQLVQQVWKFGALLALGLVLVPVRLPAVDTVLGSLLLLTALGGGLALFWIRPARLHRQNPESVGALYSIGLRFMVTSLILALAVYGEQLLVNGLGSVEDAAVFFTHATYFLFPISVLNGYVAFRIGPWLRDNHNHFLALLRNRWAAILVGAALYAVFMHGIGWAGWLLIAPVVGDPDPVLQGALLVSALARTLYTLPSGYNGVFGRPRQHDLLIAAQVVLLVLVAAGIFLFLGVVGLIYLVAVAGAVNWVLRMAIGFGVTWMIANKKRYR